MCHQKIKCVTQHSGSHPFLKSTSYGSTKLPTKLWTSEKGEENFLLNQGDKKLKKRGFLFFLDDFCHSGYSSMASFAF